MICFQGKHSYLSAYPRTSGPESKQETGKQENKKTGRLKIQIKWLTLSNDVTGWWECCQHWLSFSCLGFSSPGVFHTVYFSLTHIKIWVDIKYYYGFAYSFASFGFIFFISLIRNTLHVAANFAYLVKEILFKSRFQFCPKTDLSLGWRISQLYRPKISRSL